MKKSKLILVLAIMMLTICFGVTAKALTVVTPADKNADVFYSKNENLDDNLAVFGNNVNVDSGIDGNLIAAGNVETLKGNIKESTMVFGGTINFDGNTNNFVAAGGQINASGKVARDFVAAGGQVILNNITIGKDAFIGAGNITLNENSKVNRNLKVAGNVISIFGEVDGDLIIKGSDKIVIGDNAKINGNFIYRASSDAEISMGAKISGKVEKSIYNNNRIKFGPNLTAIIIYFIGALLAGALLLFFTPKCRSATIPIMIYIIALTNIFQILFFINTFHERL